MLLSQGLVVYACGIIANAAPAPYDGFTVSAYRGRADEYTLSVLASSRRLHSRQSATLSTAIDSILYWYGNFTVGEASGLGLLIDTGSSDLILNNGLYKPSKYATAYDGSTNFTITYEGVDREGFGFETINGTLQNDYVSGGGLSVTNQTLGVTTSFEYFDVPPLPYGNPGQGIIGFCFQGDSAFEPPAVPWFYNLCNQGLISVCRFALAFGTSGLGQMVIGKLAPSLYSGPLVSVPNIGSNQSYAVYGDVTLNNSIVLLNQTIIMDVGTDNIQAPIEQTTELFKMLQYQTQLFTEAPTSFDPGVIIQTLLGYFDCSNPPILGFSFPAQSQLKRGEKATVFNVSPDVWGVFNNSATNCTSILGGTDGITVGNVSAWLLGQPFFAGHYIDFHMETDNELVSFANLANPSDGTADSGNWEGWGSW